MKDAVKKYWAFVLMLVIVSGVCALFSYRKSGMFIDEVYSYGLANSHFAPFVTSLKEESMVDTVFTRQELTDYLTVGSEDRFDFASVYYNQTKDVHPPLYYWLMNIASSLSGGGFSKWPGLALNYIIYMLILVFLGKLALELFGSMDIAAAAAVLYGLSNIGLSTMLMVRMYALLTLFTVLLAYFVVLLLKRPSPWLYAAVGLTVFAGVMTQYYFVFYAFFLCAAYDIYALAAKKYRSMLFFSLAALAGLGLLVAVFPACLQQFSAKALVSGGSALSNLLDVGAYGVKLDKFLKARLQLKGLRDALYAALALALLCSPKILKAVKARRLSPAALILFVPAVPAFLLTAVVSPVSELRYIYNIIPIFVIGVCFLLYLAEAALGRFKYSYILKKLAVLLIAAAALWEAKWLPPDYLYPEHAEYTALAAEYADAPCVYFDDDYPAPVTQDLPQLLCFRDVYVAADPASEGLAEYVGDAERIIVYVDVSGDWSSGFDAQEILEKLSSQLGFQGCRILYSYELSQTYILSR